MFRRGFVSAASPQISVDFAAEKDIRGNTQIGQPKDSYKITANQFLSILSIKWYRSV
jgi:hypothetical protein